MYPLFFAHYATPMQSEAINLLFSIMKIILKYMAHIDEHKTAIKPVFYNHVYHETNQAIDINNH